MTLLELNSNVFGSALDLGRHLPRRDDVDLAITDWLVPHLQRATRIDGAWTGWPSTSCAFDTRRRRPSARSRNRQVAQVEFNYHAPPGVRLVHFEHPLTRGDLDRLATPFVEKTFAVCQRPQARGLRPSDLTAVILVGGSTHPRVPRGWQFFGRDPLTHHRPRRVVGLGAAILAGGPDAPGARAQPPDARPDDAPPAPPIAPTSVPPFAAVTAVPRCHNPVPVSNLRGPTLAGLAVRCRRPSGVATSPPHPGARGAFAEVPPPIPSITVDHARRRHKPPGPPPDPRRPRRRGRGQLHDLDIARGRRGRARWRSRRRHIKLTPPPGSLPGLTELDELSFMARRPLRRRRADVRFSRLRAFNIEMTRR